MKYIMCSNCGRRLCKVEAGTQVDLEIECPKCGERFVPTTAAYIAGPHTITKRKLKCPHCGAVSYCRKRLTH